MIKEIEEKIIKKEILSEQETKLFLKYVIHATEEIVKDDTFINKCDLVQGIIGRFFNKLGLKIFPCITNKCIMPNVIGHSFLIVEINKNNYIIDPTFIQFACQEYSELYINHTRVKSKSPYYYASIINKELTKALIIDGYIKLSEESAYLYGNSFYHTLTNIKDTYVFKNIDGRLYIKKFFEGNEALRKYNYREIKVLTEAKAK